MYVMYYTRCFNNFVHLKYVLLFFFLWRYLEISSKKDTWISVMIVLWMDFKVIFNIELHSWQELLGFDLKEKANREYMEYMFF